jgi:hypothetical protein
VFELLAPEAGIAQADNGNSESHSTRSDLS